jgi:hypothetical protein
MDQFSFRPTGFRTIDPTSPPTGVRKGGIYSLILVKVDGSAQYANTATGKDRLVSEFDPTTDLLLMAWTGQWKTDIFHLTKEDLDRIY